MLTARGNVLGVPNYDCMCTATPLAHGCQRLYFTTDSNHHGVLRSRQLAVARDELVQAGVTMRCINNPDRKSVV